MAEFARPVSDRYFEGYLPGVDIRCGAELVDEADILRFASEFDPQAIHADPPAVAKGRSAASLPRDGTQRPITMRIVAVFFLNEKASLASPGVDELRWTRPVRPGDVLSARFEILEARPSRSKPEHGIIRTRITVFHDRDEAVLSLVAMNMLRRRPAD